MTQLAYLQESCVRYTEGDMLGELLAYCSLGHIFVVACYTTLVVSVRDVQILAAFAAQLVCAKLTSTLKKVIQQPRPVNSPADGSGMPSNHSQFLFFFATFHVLCICSRVPERALAWPWRLVHSTALLALAASVAFSRYYLWYHTAEQVAAGSALGIVLGAICFHLLYKNAAVQGLLRWTCGTNAARYFGIRYATDFYYPPRFYEYSEKPKSN